MRQVTLVARRGDRHTHVVINLEDDEMPKDAFALLQEIRPDWKAFSHWRFTADDGYEMPINWPVKPVAPVRLFDDFASALDAMHGPVVDIRVKPVGLPKPHYREMHIDEPDIPHNWGIGLGEGLDYLDAETRHMINEAISIDDMAMEETFHG